MITNNTGIQIKVVACCVTQTMPITTRCIMLAFLSRHCYAQLPVGDIEL